MWIELTKHNGDRVFINMNLASDFSQSRLSANTIINMAGSNGGSNKIEVTEDIQTISNKIIEEERRVAGEAANFYKD